MLRIGRLHWVLDVSMDEDHAQPQGQRHRLPRRHPAAGAEHRPDGSRQAVRPTQVRMRQRSDDVLLEMIRRIRRRE